MIKKLLLYPLVLLLSVIVLYVAWALIAFRDIPVEVLEAKYGGENLQRVEVEGVTLRYKVEGQGPALLLIHSHFYTMRMWQPWVDMLKDQFTIIRYDLTSHGLTGPDPTQDYTRARAADLIDGLLDHVGVDQVSIAGSSTGGAIAFYYAATRPEKVSDLVIINAPGMPKVSNKYMEMGLPSWGGYAFYLLPESIFRAFLEAPVIDKSLITDEGVHEFHEMYRRDGNRMAEFYRMSNWEKADAAPVLAKVTAPTLIMWGEKNPQLPLVHVEQFTERLKNSERVEAIVYPNTGHVIPLELPEQSAIDVKTFLLNN
jgi:pimeloyl-ACP methyl ester carboxylesterase